MARGNWKITAKIEGIEKLRDIYRIMPRVMFRRVLRPAMAMEGTRVLKAAKQGSPIGTTKLLKKSLGKKVKSYPKNNAVVVIIGPRRGFRQVINGDKHDPAKYGHLVEFGTKPHWIGKKKFLGISYGRKKRNYIPRMHPGGKPSLFLTRTSRQTLVGAYSRIRARVTQEIAKLVASGKWSLPSESDSGGESDA